MLWGVLFPPHPGGLRRGGLEQGCLALEGIFPPPNTEQDRGLYLVLREELFPFLLLFPLSPATARWRGRALCSTARPSWDMGSSSNRAAAAGGTLAPVI